MVATRRADAVAARRGERDTRGPRGDPACTRPTIGEGVVWYGMAFLLLFYVGATLQAQRPQLGLVVTLWVLILGGSVAMAKTPTKDHRG